MTLAKILQDSTGEAINDTLGRIADALGGKPADFHYNMDTREYDNIKYVFDARATGLLYSVTIPDGTSTVCVKGDANAALQVIPSSATVAAKDDYQGINAFTCLRVNGIVGDDGMPHVSAIEGHDDRFSTDGSNGDVWVMTPVLWWKLETVDGGKKLTITDRQRSGFKLQPRALLPDGTVRPYILYAAYAGGKGADGKLYSYAGLPIYNDSYSHNTSHTIAAARGAGYSGKTIADDWYIKVMMLIKYATKNSQSVFGGCASYDKTANITVAESNVKRVIVSASDGAYFLVGSSVYVAASRSGVRYRIISKEEYDASNTVLNLDIETAITTDTGGKVITAPYHSGYCDSVLGTDGAPVSATSAKEPFRLQNIECMLGCYEILSDVILKGAPTQEAYVCFDSSMYATSLTEDYIKVGEFVGTAGSGWKYPTEFADASGLLLPHGTAGSTSSGLADGYYLPSESTALFEWLGVGTLDNGSIAGLWCVYGLYGLSSASWYFAGRLSSLGLSGVSA